MPLIQAEPSTWRQLLNPLLQQEGVNRAGPSRATRRACRCMHAQGWPVATGRRRSKQGARGGGGGESMEGKGRRTKKEASKQTQLAPSRVVVFVVSAPGAVHAREAPADAHSSSSGALLMGQEP